MYTKYFKVLQWFQRHLEILLWFCFCHVFIRNFQQFLSFTKISKQFDVYNVYFYNNFSFLNTFSVEICCVIQISLIYGVFFFILLQKPKIFLQKELQESFQIIRQQKIIFKCKFEYFFGYKNYVQTPYLSWFLRSSNFVCKNFVC